jgi:hypothetical protein
MPMIHQTPQTLTLRNEKALKDSVLGIILIVLGLFFFSAVIYIFEFVTLTCNRVGESGTSCAITQAGLWGRETIRVDNVEDVYLIETLGAGTGRFQVQRDQLILVTEAGREVAVPAFYRADFGRMQSLTSRIRAFTADPGDTPLTLREHYPIEHEFLNIIGGIVLIGLGFAQIILQVTSWVFDRSDSRVSITKNRVLGQQVIKEQPTLVQVERSTDIQNRGTLDGIGRSRSWVSMQFASGRKLRLTNKYDTGSAESEDLDIIAYALRVFLKIKPQST